MSLENFSFIKKFKEKTNSFVESLNFQKKNTKASLVQIELRVDKIIFISELKYKKIVDIYEFCINR